MINKKEWKNYIKKVKNVRVKVDQEILKKELFKTIENLVPNKKFGVLFSGGVDSSFIALVCKQLKKDFICYVIGLDNSEDVLYAKKIAKELRLKLKVIHLSLNEAEKVIGKTTKLLNTSDVTKVGVGSVVYAAMGQAKKDNVHYLFSGLGSEEIFAGYQRHELAKDIQKECWNGLSLMYDRDLERDFTLSNYFKIKLLTPFLEEKIITLAMNVPVKNKINKQNNKLILRQIADEIGLNKEIAFRKKRAAQYGSRVDRAILRLARKNNFKFKKDYLASFLKPSLGCLFSSGKDSTYAMYLIKQKGYPVKCLINIDPKNEFSYMYHKPDKQTVKLQADSMSLPLVYVKSKGEKEKELKDLEVALKLAKQKYNIKGIITGALYSNYQRIRIEKLCKKLKLECFNPLWHINQEDYMRKLITNKFKIIFTKIAADGLDKSWLGKIISDKDIDELVKINKKIGINVAGEGGEFESLVIDCPLFKSKINIKKYEVKEESKNNADFIIKEVVLS
ncbi:hypothetical protein CEE44_00930 [Candidatus Woesearchaeota archaeon B3_Woes]|nr:MAG: hypothetical protein CEE44_00930 [Candidatus Woesearchaeota archaeon B3_Woes]